MSLSKFSRVYFENKQINEIPNFLKNHIDPFMFNDFEVEPNEISHFLNNFMDRSETDKVTYQSDTSGTNPYVESWVEGLPEEFSETASNSGISFSSFEAQNEGFISRLFAFVRRNFTSASDSVRGLGIRTRSVIERTIKSLFSFLRTMFVKFSSFISAVESLFVMSIDSICNKIRSYCIDTMGSVKGIIYSMIALTLALVAFILPSSAITGYGRFLVVALSVIIQYYQDVRVTGVGVALIAILQSFSARMNVNVTVNNSTQYQGVKEDCKEMLTQILGLTMLFTASTAGLEFPSNAASLEAMLKRHSMAYRSYQAWEFMADKLSEVVETSTKMICKYALGVEYTSFEHITEVDDLYREVMQLCTLGQQLRIGRDPILAARIEVLYVQYLHLRKTYANNAAVRETLNSIGAPLTAYYRRVSNKNPKAHVMRQEPVCFLITGDTGIGKSYLMAPLQQDLLKICGKFDPEGNMEGLIYARCVEQEFWDGYTGQPIVVYDDFGQKVDSQVNPNEEFFEMIRSVNIFPYQLHSAELADKANNPFTSDFIVLTTNLEVFRPKSIQCEAALQRRFHLQFKMKLIPEVMTSDGRLDMDALQRYRVDKNLKSSDLSHTLFEHKSTGETISYEEMVVRISKQYEKHYKGYETRTQNAHETKHHKLPKSAFCMDPRWSSTGAIPQADFQEHLQVTTSALFNQSPDIRREFYQRYQPHVINSHRFTIHRCNSVEEFHQAARTMFQEYLLPFVLRTSVTYIPTTVIGPIIIRPSHCGEILRGREFNQYIRGHFTDFIESPPSEYTENDYEDRRQFFSLWSAWSRFRDFMVFNYGKIFRYTTVLLVTGGIISYFGKYITPYFSQHEFHKAPLMSTLARIVLREGVGAISTALSVPIIGGVGVLYINYSIIRDFARHGIFHTNFEKGCTECQHHLKSLQAIEKDKEPLKFEEAASIVLQANPEAGVSGSNKDHLNQYRARKTQLEGDCEEFQAMQSQSPVVKPESADTLERLFPKELLTPRPIVKTEGIISSHAENIIAKCSRNMWWLEVHYDGIKKDIGHVFVLKGQDALINYHFLQMISIHLHRCEDKTTFMLMFKQHGQKMGVFDHLQRFLESVRGHQVVRGQVKTEFYMFMMPSACQFGSDLTKHLVKASDLSKLTRNLAVKMFTFEKRDVDSFVYAYRDGFFETLEKTAIRDLIDTNLEHWYPETARYLMTSKEGDCGSPIFLNSDMFERKLLGFHFAGMDGEGKGMCSIVTLEDVLPHLRSQMVAPERKDVLPVTQGLRDEFPLKDGSFFLLGETKFKIAHPCKSKLMPSAIHGVFGEPECVPAILAPPLVPDGPMLKALKKNEGTFVPLDTKQKLILNRSIRDYFQTCIQPHNSFPYEKKVLTFEEACAGIEGDQYFPPLKRSKSAGYPYMTQAKKGKTDWLGTDEWKFNTPKCQELRCDVENLIMQCRQGIVPEVYFVATLKDEKRPIEKVRQGKTRVFSACPLHFSIAFRQYFLGFLAFMTRNRTYTECAVGTNVYSKDWERLVQYLNRWGDQYNLIAGDFENFDGGVHPEIFESIVDAVNAFYADGQENAQIRRCLFKVICQPVHIMDKFAFAFTHGQPSGNPSTAITNSIYVSILLRFIYFQDESISSKFVFGKNIRLQSYGDDNIIALSPWLAKEIGPSYFANQLFKILGVVYTRADKTKFTDDDKFQHISEISFLKRTFSYGALENHWFAPLELRSIREMCNWVSKSPDHNNLEATLDNCEGAMLELIHHPQEVFDKYSSLICKALSDIGLSTIPPDWQSNRLEISLGQFSCERAWI